MRSRKLIAARCRCGFSGETFKELSDKTCPDCGRNLKIKTHRIPGFVQPGAIVDYSSVIGEAPTLRGCIITSEVFILGQTPCVRISMKGGAVAVEALSETWSSKLTDAQKSVLRATTSTPQEIGDTNINPGWVKAVLDAVYQKPDHTFMVLTKMPERIPETVQEMDLPPNLWIGISVTCQKDTWRISKLREVEPVAHKFISFEPLHGPITLPCKRIMADFGWFIVGAETGNRKDRIVPEWVWIWSLCNQVVSDLRVPLFMKNNLAPHLQEGCKLIQQFPEGI